MVSQDVAIKPGIIKVVLKSDAKALDEVVVTALGIKRSEKILGYAASTVKSDDLVAAKSGSVMSGLSGKIACVVTHLSQVISHYTSSTVCPCPTTPVFPMTSATA